jgi:hypothetical protein
MPPTGTNLMNEDVAAPSMLNGCLGVPDPILNGGELFENRYIVVIFPISSEWQERDHATARLKRRGGKTDFSDPMKA